MNRPNILICAVWACLIAGPTLAESAEQESFLILEQAERAVVAEGKITLSGIDGSMLAFSNRPFRDVKTIEVEGFVTAWKDGANDATQDPPNVAITGLQDGEQVGFVVVLSEPALSEDRLSFAIRPLAGSFPSELSEVSLLFDAWTIECCVP